MPKNKNDFIAFVVYSTLKNDPTKITIEAVWSDEKIAKDHIKLFGDKNKNYNIQPQSVDCYFPLVQAKLEILNIDEYKNLSRGTKFEEIRAQKRKELKNIRERQLLNPIKPEIVIKKNRIYNSTTKPLILKEQPKLIIFSTPKSKFENKLIDLGFNHYKEYLFSEHWKMVKYNYYNDENTIKYCNGCGAKTNLQLHHLSYDNIGHETLSDLMLVCGNCHNKIHNNFNSAIKNNPYNKFISLREVTLDTLDEIRNSKIPKGEEFLYH